MPTATAPGSARNALSARAEDLLGLIGARVLGRRTARYRQFLGNDVTSDERYAFGDAFRTTTASLSTPLAVPAGGLVLLDVALRCRGLGGVRDPFVTLRSPSTGACVRQYVERSLRARRYLNVTALSGLTDVTLEASDLEIEADTASFVVGPHVPVAGPLLVLAPHPDDAELAAFGLYQGRDDTWVVTATAGELGTHDYGGLFPNDPQGVLLRGKVRVAESVTAPLIGGVAWERTANLGYFDGSLMGMFLRPNDAVKSGASADNDLSLFRKSTPQTLLPARARASWRGLVDDIVHLLRVSRARTVVFPHPIIERHSDHVALGLALLAALGESEHKPAQLLSYAVHTPGGTTVASIHPVGARDGTVSLPPCPPGASSDALFDALCSISLSDETLRRKALALDTYRDLKDQEGPLPPEELGVRVRRGLREVYRALTIYDAGLLRRFLRPNELFFALDVHRAADWEQRCGREARARFDAGA